MSRTKNELLYQPKGQKSGDSSALFVSLYIVLLAFFIMLNSISKIDEEKTEEALDSVSDAFSLNKLTLKVPEILRDSGTEIAHQTFFGEMQKIISDGMPVKEVSSTQYGNEMYLFFDKRTLFHIGDSINPELNVFVERIATIVNRWNQHNKLEIELLSGIAKDDLMKRKTALRLSSNEAAIIAKYLINKKIPDENILAGISTHIRHDEFMFVFKFRNRKKTLLRLIQTEENN